jgi:hypothetical protein
MNCCGVAKLAALFSCPAGQNMSTENDFYAWLGIHVPDLIAGLSGGIVNSFVVRRSDPWSIIGSVVVGALTANYLSGLVGQYTGTSGGAAAFIVGLAGMAICQGVISAAKSWKPSFSKEVTDVRSKPTSRID